MLRGVRRAAELAGLGKDLVALRKRRGAARKSAPSRLVERLARLHGLPQKIGQILSLGELNDDAPIFTKLVETPAQLSQPEVLAEIDRALARPWRDCFRFVDPAGIGASLSQVHRAVLHDGRQAAIKIQYPHVAEALDLDLKALRWLTMPVGGLRRGFDLAGYRREVAQMLQQELDYRHEAEMLKHFRQFAQTQPDVSVPGVIEEFSGERILTMTWISGSSFSAARFWPLEARSQIAATLLSLFFTGIFSAHMLHADPHPGNYRFQRGPESVTTGLLDFGCVQTLTPHTVHALHAIIADTAAGRLRADPERAKARFVDLGFNPLLLGPMQHLLPELCEVLFEPLLLDRAFDMRTWRLGRRVEQALGEFRWNFRMAGPPALIYFMRAYQGLVQYVSALNAPVNWRAIYQCAASSQPEQTSPVKTAGGESRPTQSQTLHIRVVLKGRTKAELMFPATAAENLSDLIPPDVEPKLVARNIDVSLISESLVASGFPPGELFSLREGEDNFRIWLE